MDTKDQTIAISLNDVTTDSQDTASNYGTNYGDNTSNNGHGRGGDQGGYPRRKNYYNNGYHQRSNRQGHQQHYNHYNGHNNGNHHQQNSNGFGSGRNYDKRNQYYHSDHFVSNYQHATNNHSYRHYGQYNNSYRNNYFQHSNYQNNRQGESSRNGANQPQSSPVPIEVEVPSRGALSPSSSNTPYSRPSSVVSTASDDKLTDTLSSSSSSADGIAPVSMTTYTSSEDESKVQGSPPRPISSVTVIVNPPPIDTVTPLFAELEAAAKRRTPSGGSILCAMLEVNNPELNRATSPKGSIGMTSPRPGTTPSEPSRERFVNNNYPSTERKSYYSYPPAGQGQHHLHVHSGDGNRGSHGHTASTSYDNRYYNPHHGHHGHQNQRRSEPSFEIFSPQNGIPYAQYYPTAATLDPALLSHLPVFNPGPQFVFPDNLQFTELGKAANIGLNSSWSFDPEGIDDPSITVLAGSPGGSIQNGSQGSAGNYKKRVSNGGNGQYSNRLSPNPPQQQQQQFYQRRYSDYGRTFHFENRWNWNNNTLRLDDLLDRFHYVDDSEKPDELAPVGHEYAKLSEQIWTRFQQNQQTLDTFTRKLELWRDLSNCVRAYNPAYRLEMVGSTISGFGSNTSDVDMCLILNHRNEVDPRATAIDLLEAMCPMFETVPNLTRKELILAKVPILKLRENVHGIDVDINVNNAVGIWNSRLLHSYAMCDWRVRPLVLVVKLWAQVQGINDAKLMTLSSYSLALMVIHFLQHGVSPAILPCLQAVSPDRYPELAELWRVKKTLSFVDRIPPVENLENVQTLGELLVGFLEYFAVKFDYRSSAISVRNGSTLSIRACSNSRAPKNDAYQWKHICIEEPFEQTNTARSVYDKDSFDRIRGVFFSSWQRLVISRNLDTNFQCISPGEARSIGARARQAVNN